MNILFLSAWFPYPPDNGSRIRIFNLLRYLSRQHEVTLLSFLNHERDRQWVDLLRGFCKKVEVVPGREFQPWSPRALTGFLSPWPRYLLDVYSQEMQELVEEALSEHHYDVVIGSQIKMVPYIVGLEEVPAILEELEISLTTDLLSERQGLLESTRYWLQWQKCTRFMGRLLRRELAGCTVVSEPEHANVLRIVPDYERVAVVPNGVDIEHYTGDFGKPILNTLVFSGALSYFANFDAMAFFLSEIWPYVRAGRPGARLFITGRTEGVPLERLPVDGSVTFTGYLEDIRSQVARSQACVVPLRKGGGTRLKILEAMALGTPVVATRKGAEGLEVTHGENILIADEPTGFADAVLHLLGDEALRAKLAANGRRLLEERYSWKTCAQKLEQLLYQVVEQKKGIE